MCAGIFPGVSGLRISIDGNKKSVGEFIEFREPLGGGAVSAIELNQVERRLPSQAPLLRWKCIRSARANTIKSHPGIKKHSQINNRIFAPESACNTNRISSAAFFLLCTEKSPYVTRH